MPTFSEESIVIAVLVALSSIPTLVNAPLAVSVVNAPVDAEDAPMAVPSIEPALMSMC